jgi:uncharacterized protein YbaR (Trm112 family)
VFIRGWVLHRHLTGKEIMIDSELMKILCCPETHQALRPTEGPLLEKLNQQIAAGQLRNRAGAAVNEPLGGGLVRADGKYLYPVRGNLPLMLVDEAIELNG